jgi:hypothetical protein
MYDYSIFNYVYDKHYEVNISSKSICPISHFSVKHFEALFDVCETRKLDGYLAPPPPRPQSGREIPAVDSISYFSDLHKNIVPKETSTCCVDVRARFISIGSNSSGRMVLLLPVRLKSAACYVDNHPII